MTDINNINIQLADNILVPKILRTKSAGSDPYANIQELIQTNKDSIRTQLNSFAAQLEKADEYVVIDYEFNPFTIPWQKTVKIPYRISGDTMAKLYLLGSANKSIMSILAFYAYGFSTYQQQSEDYLASGGCFCKYEKLQSFFEEYIGL